MVFSFFIFFLFFGFLFLLQTIDERRHKISVALVFTMVMHWVIIPSDCIATNSYLTTLEYDECNVIFHGVCWHGIKSSQHVEVWEDNGIHEESTFEELFWKYVLATNKVKLWHISFIDKGCGYKSWAKNTHMSSNIPVETRVAMVFAWRGSGNSLQRCGEVYDIVKSTMTIIMRKFYWTTKKHLKPLVIPKNKIK